MLTLEDMLVVVEYFLLPLGLSLMINLLPLVVAGRKVGISQTAGPNLSLLLVIAMAPG